MERFYRNMRRRTGYLLDADGAPEGGKWNLDAENREPLPRRIPIPDRPSFPPDAETHAVLELVARRFGNHFGSLEGFDHPVTRADALAHLGWFAREALPRFGTFQDAMRQGEPLLFHSHVSALVNGGLLGPAECCEAALAEYEAGRAPLNAVEGFVRQIIGWREYVRGIYWLKGPEYKLINALEADRKLPWFYWSGETDMACVRDVVSITRDHAYAHHIQRLMVTGNLAMLLGVHPDEINEWYLVVYADAYEWVELPNVHGMATFADGGIIGSKPYAASGAYINRMSNYCGRCRYDVEERIGADACPFNALYWDFIIRNKAVLAGNRRMDMPYRTLGRMKAATQEAITTEAERIKREFGAVPLKESSTRVEEPVA